MPDIESISSSAGGMKSKPKKLVLCFDGTGNTFSGSTSDTNIVKLYNKFDRDTPDQFHYYQTGIGTYDIDGGSMNRGFLGGIRSSISRTIDSGFGTSFDAHVIAGYRFIMRYYDAGDRIYMFGFSRGAYTARFLSRMINTVGLLSKGNEEMVPFAYELYQRYEQGKLDNYGDENASKHAEPALTNGHTGTDPDTASLPKGAVVRQATGDGYNDSKHIDDNGPLDIRVNELHAFSRTFCRREGVGQDPRSSEYYYTGVKVYFLGIFDCVNSVAVLETNPPKPISVVGTAKYVRHAVAVDERRVKFKAALLAQDSNSVDPRGECEDRKEVWFPGNHGDVGGGWPAPYKEPEPSMWQKFVAFVTFQKKRVDDRAAETGPLQMSDIPLAWMIRELEEVGEKEPKSAVEFSARKDNFLRKFTLENWREAALTAKSHDTMTLKGGSSVKMVFLWNLMELLPFFPRQEYNVKTRTWQLRRWLPNWGQTRDIPQDAVLHSSLVARLRNTTLNYHPRNDHGDGKRCLESKNLVLVPETNKSRPGDDMHRLYTFKE